jgi:hypothetical protein
MKEELVDVSELNNEELIELYEEILKHIKYLNDNILDESEGTTNG